MKAVSKTAKVSLSASVTEKEKVASLRRRLLEHKMQDPAVSASDKLQYASKNGSVSTVKAKSYRLQ